MGVPVESVPTQPAPVALLDMFPSRRPGAEQWRDSDMRYLVVPLLRQECPIAGRTHKSNHQYVIVDTRAMRWRHKCHNAQCSQKPQPWQAMPDFCAARALLVTTSIPELPVRLAATPVSPSKACPRANGPPPHGAFARLGVNSISCKNGIFNNNI